MKIHQLPMGARFEYEGEEYVKSGPMFATGKGGQRLIPKYAILAVNGQTGGAEAKVAQVEKAGSLARDRVLSAFDVFYAQCRGLVPEASQETMQAARDAFLKSLG